MPPIVLFDTEFTAWPGSRERNWRGPGEHREVIQLAALKIDYISEGIQIEQSFNELVCPAINPTLSDYIVDLTGITQHALENHGVDYASALKAFHQFTEQGQLRCFCWGKDDEVLMENARLLSLPQPEFGGGFENLMDVFNRAGIAVNDVCSGDLHKVFQLPLKGEAHNALHDVRSMAVSLEHILAQGLLDWSELTQTR
ncbi:hypothetical protein HMF8227_01330 [Saliniradius amylolyticus]|uniref:Exonuclease domain-containing protein n=1 Tax=Saliniradius amylolyticus TaxID=2183582 RepID=A0A2S2E2E0_9ALTE|nr:3'-5' exonuclease [Saliniradius amylolyticus]AWL11808.1 hypothetical protein HMF8227_01330 [Saliniradius amylolyticus]